MMGRVVVGKRKDVSVMLIATRLTVMLAVSLISVFGRSQDFSADVVYLLATRSAARFSNTDVMGHNPAKLYVSSRRSNRRSRRRPARAHENDGRLPPSVAGRWLRPCLLSSPRLVSFHPGTRH
jgi:hypothetical protein